MDKDNLPIDRILSPSEARDLSNDDSQKFWLPINHLLAAGVRHINATCPGLMELSEGHIQSLVLMCKIAGWRISQVGDNWFSVYSD